MQPQSQQHNWLRVQPPLIFIYLFGALILIVGSQSLKVSKTVFTSVAAPLDSQRYGFGEQMQVDLNQSSDLVLWMRLHADKMSERHQKRPKITRPELT